MSAIVLLLTNPNSSPGLILLTMIVLLLPCSQSAVQVVNYLITSILRPRILPKLDFSKKIPDDCITLVAIPSLLLNENQVRRLVEDLEVRFLGNHDRNLHFALLTDLPDSPFPPREDDPLVELCSSLITELNEKYADLRMGSFLLLHRHRTYNPREQAWMGWERKRGKILDLNKLLRRQFDSFPIKVGDVSILQRIRFVITLDSDTELPRGSAHRMIGALDHPLNQAIIDPELNIVVAGYGILQPRVVVSVQSAARSRLAKIYSGQTGLDIYTQAISDVYQDLYGEGTFAGKGIYEVDVLQRVLDGRFPQNALLSHDLVEGAYARAGLVSDIQVIEDYPSHYSAYNRRKHRWLRGDWQVVEWLTSRVPDETGTRRENPISVISQWKILDNLRRSLVEPATFLLFVLGWLCLPGSPRSWTLAAIAILFVPAWCRAIFELVRAAGERRLATARSAVRGLLAANVNVLLSLTFLAHQMLLSVDAMIRTLVRRIVTRRRLLQWETAAEAELAAKTRSPADVYLDWALPLAVGVGLVVGSVRPEALLAALPVVLLWAGSKSASVWLNLPPRAPRNQVSEEDRVFLRGAALRTWRYFAEFSNEEHNWLIPDNTQGEPLRVAPRLSPTNLGLLLNCRQVACRFGYLAVPEFADQTQKTLDSMAKLEKYRGHLFNWYDTRTLQALPPRFVSSVDNGNLVASLWTLDQGCRELLRQPLLPSSLVDGLMDHLRILRDEKVLSRRSFFAIDKALSAPNWLRAILTWRDADLETVCERALQRGGDVYWFAVQAQSQVASIKKMVRTYTPWLLPEFEPLINKESAWKGDNVPIERLPGFIDQLASRLQSLSNSEPEQALAERLLAQLPEARQLSVRLISDLRQLASQARELVAGMDFRFLLHPQRKLLSVGFDVESQQLNAACYDLLASEARTAVFVAIAKDEIPQETWFMLGRPYTLDQGRPVLCSWTGTLFEYLMPFIWMRSFPDTLLERSREAAVRAQRAYTAKKHIPWGISESACAKKDDSGVYNYFAFGIPSLALQKGEMNAIVISPYSTFLALPVDPDEALKNLREMSERGWVGPYGFYEAADFTFPAQRSWRRRGELVRCWMAHHQGMSLLSIANFLGDGMVQHWFHREPRVQATELLLQEKPVTYGRPPLEKYGTTAA
jgi:cyclic beta-1,2-glucan synthetase